MNEKISRRWIFAIVPPLIFLLLYLFIAQDRVPEALNLTILFSVFLIVTTIFLNSIIPIKIRIRRIDFFESRFQSSLWFAVLYPSVIGYSIPEFSKLWVIFLYLPGVLLSYVIALMFSVILGFYYFLFKKYVKPMILTQSELE